MPRADRPSLTAAKVARLLVFVGQDPRYAPLLPAGAAAATEALLVATGGLERWMQRFYANRHSRAWLERISERLGPGQLVRIALRKRFMDDEIRAALAAGAGQVLVIGAGYDTACMRLAPEFPDRRFIEIDHPATHASKQAGVAALGAARPNLHLIGADLATTTLVHALAQLPAGPRGAAGWDPEARTIVVAEGVLMYLAPAAVSRAFTAVHALTGPGSRVAFSYLGCDAEGRPRIGGGGVSLLTRWSLALVGEALRWCVADEAALAATLAPLGWAYTPASERFDLAARYLAPAGLDDRDRLAEHPPAERLAVVERR